MPKLKTQHTNKLFFKRFKYKAVVQTPQTSFIRYATRKDIDALFSAEKLEQWQGVQGPLSYGYSNFTIGSIHDYKSQSRKRVWNNRFTLYKLFNWITTNYNTNDHKIRNEGDKLAFFTNDKKLWEDFCGTFKNEISELVWPKNEQHEQYFNEHPNNIICKQLPYNKYRFKINLCGEVVRNEGFGDWIKNYKGELKASDNLIKGIKRGYYYSDGKFLYSTNSEMMLLLQMYLGDTIRNIQEYITEEELDEQHKTA